MGTRHYFAHREDGTSDRESYMSIRIFTIGPSRRYLDILFIEINDYEEEILSESVKKSRMLENRASHDRPCGEA